MTTVKSDVIRRHKLTLESIAGIIVTAHLKLRPLKVAFAASTSGWENEDSSEPTNKCRKDVIKSKRVPF